MEKLSLHTDAKSHSDESLCTSVRQNAARFLRVLTVPPLMAFFLVTALYSGMGQNAFRAPIRYFEAVFALGILPVLAYPICASVPSLKAQGRRAERSLAIIFSVLGYLMGTLFAVLGNGTRLELELYITYTISGVLIGLFSFVFGFKASGHGCGASAPFVMLAYKLGCGWLFGLLLLIPVFYSSIRLKRHKASELAAGAAISVCSMIATVFIVGLIELAG